MNAPTTDKREVILDMGISNPDAVLNALHQAGWAIVPKREANEGYWEQKIANDQVRQMQRTGVCPNCGSEQR